MDVVFDERLSRESDGEVRRQGARPMPRWQPEKEWAEPTIPWNKLVARWNQSRDLLEEKIRNLPIDDLAKQVSGRS